MAFKGFVLKGEWSWQPGEKARFYAHLRSLKDGAWDMPKPTRPTRSQRANAYYWSTVLPLIAEHTGYKADEIHDWACQRFIPDELKRIEFFNAMTGEVLRGTVDARRSSKLTGEAFYTFVEEVREWARTFLHVETPDPDPEYWRKRGRVRATA